MLQKRQAAEVGYCTQPENILDADRMNLVETNIDKADNFRDVRDAFCGGRRQAKLLRMSCPQSICERPIIGAFNVIPFP